MENPFFKLSVGIKGNIGKACMAGFDAEIMNYRFHDGMGNSSYLGIARKDQFAGDQEAFICIAMRYHRYDGARETLNLTEYLKLSTPEDFIEDAERTMVPVYGHAEIKEMTVEEFIKKYDDWIDCMTSYSGFQENGKIRYKYNDSGIYRNGEEYRGNYQLFHPLYGEDIEKCFLILDNWNRKEYFAFTDRYYLFLNEEFHSL